MNILFKRMSAACLLVSALTACGGGDDVASASPSPLSVDAYGMSTFESTTLSASLMALPLETLTTEEQNSLAFMREEEKLAHDVYAQLDTLWSNQTRVFVNIAKSEATHTEAIRQLLVRYNLTDPSATRVAGQYQSTKLQALYTQLVATGTLSLIEALKVGSAIEEIDMIDINTALLSIDNQDIVLVYQNLLKGSRNHLRAFVSALTNQGVTYVPQYMALADYQTIISQAIER